MNDHGMFPSSSVTFEQNFTVNMINQNSSGNNSLPSACTVSLQYRFLEHVFYLYLLSPLCLIGLLLNIINLIVFADRSFKNLTFKYLRLIAFVDCITCVLVFIYCVTNYTQPRSMSDKYFRTWYLVNVYFPLANITAACNVLLTLTVTIERLVSIRWPMSKQRLFDPKRVLLTLIICFLFPVLANSVNFAAYEVGACNNADRTRVARGDAYKYFGICKEILLRFIPICILICSNCLLLSTVHAANRKFKPKKRTETTLSVAVSSNLLNNGCESKSASRNLSESPSQLETLMEDDFSQGPSRTTSAQFTTNNKMHARKQQQEKQLTMMLVWISTLYLCGQIPMLFAFPNFVFKDINGAAYKYYAVVVNFLELSAYLANFFIYMKFTTQYQQVFRTKIRQIFSCLIKTP